jgi:hypothetical protein
MAPPINGAGHLPTKKSRNSILCFERRAGGGCTRPQERHPKPADSFRSRRASSRWVGLGRPWTAPRRLAAALDFRTPRARSSPMRIWFSGPRIGWFRPGIILCTAVACIAFGRTQALAYTDFGQGRPITAKDIAGKTICWSRKGVRANFAANGQYTDNQHRPGFRDQWSVPEPGVYELDIGIGRWRFCKTDIALFAVTTTLIRGGRNVVERAPQSRRRRHPSKPWPPPCPASGGRFITT